MRKIVAGPRRDRHAARVNKSTITGLVGVLALAAGVAMFLVRRGNDQGPAPPKSASTMKPSASPENQNAGPDAARMKAESRSRPPEPPAKKELSPEEKTARVQKIKTDYDEIRAKASADYSAGGRNFPGGLNAFLRQLALLEREKRADLATVLTPRELEDLEMKESNAGQVVQRWLGDTAATEEQRRAVFRLQRAFEERFALTFDVTPAALVERESARQDVQEKIRAALGNELFGAWLRGEGDDYARFTKFSQKFSLPADTALDLWRAKNEYTLRKLVLATKPQVATPQQQRERRELVQLTEARVMSIVGAGAWSAARNEVLGWLPKS